MRSSGLWRGEWFLEPAGHPSVYMQLRRAVDELNCFGLQLGSCFELTLLQSNIFCEGGAVRPGLKNREPDQGALALK